MIHYLFFVSLSILDNLMIMKTIWQVPRETNSMNWFLGLSIYNNFLISFDKILIFFSCDFQNNLMMITLLKNYSKNSNNKMTK